MAGVNLVSVFADPRSRKPYIFVCLISVLFSQDVTMFGMILASVGRELGAGSEALVPYIYAGALLSLAGFVIPAGRACDLFGPKKCAMLGMGLSFLGYVLTLFAPTLLFVVLGRALTGSGMALLWPSLLALASLVARDEEQRKQGFNLIHMVQVLTAVAGALMGGFLATTFGWRAAPLFSLCFTVLCLVLTPLLLAKLPPVETKKVSLNLGTAAVLTLGVTCLLWTLSTSIRGGITQGSFVTGGLAVVLLVSFYLLNRRSDAPILPPSLFRYRNVLAANLTVALASAITGTTFLIGAVYLQKVAQYSAQGASIVVFPRAAAAIAGGILAGLLLSRFSGRMTATIGIGFMLIGAVILLQLTPEWAMAILLAAIFVMAVGDMLTNPGLLAEALADMPVQMHGLGSALFMVFIVFGGATISTTTLVILESGGDGTQITPESLHRTMLILAAMPVLALIANLTAVRTLTRAKLAPAQ